MKTSTIHARIEPKLKKDAEKILKEVGLSMSDAINMFLRQVSMQKGIPFDVRIPNKETQKAMREADLGIGLKRFSSVEELFKDLND